MSDRFAAMHAFVAVCDAQGFAAAARRLDVAPSMVTRLVAGLEVRLGVRLLHRTTRTVRLTGAGARFLDRARRILAEVEEAEASAQDEHTEPRGRLVVNAPLLFGRMHVAPVMSDYLAAHPQVTAELQVSDRFCNLVEDGVDVAVRIGNLASSGLIARRLGQTRRMLVASPAYLAAQGGPPRSPSELAGHQLILFRAMPSGRDWTPQQPDGSALASGAPPRFVTDSGDAAFAHAVGGGGITAAFCYQVAAALRAGALVEVLADMAPPPVPIHAVFPSARLMSAKVRAFLDMVEQAASRWQFLNHA